ncbi:Glucose/arabinose dehydrogenase, beta-propeller fold [Thalassobacillus cyri]|uniref:Glucose/arabinose dehydrogenase, beta-propeller fold n=1 Tax=Thalassobacillus cyri TaxID=571932 RepID=A0A1H3Y6S7_9BACI|nr:PQQ-dependent sugar dehydrogenase [Thalassobacillus cyri]SEA07253.1 Glucose/arabinose dehydrogenase, beta-propeller fold [Thalassobacillus cyri]
MAKLLFLFLSLILVTGCSSSNEPPETKTPDENNSKRSTIEVLTANLNSPWDIEIAGDTFFITEREGNIISWAAGTNQERQQVITKKAIHQQGEGGLLGFQLRPDFSETKEAYVYHTYRQDGATKNRVIVIRLEDGQWREVDVVLEDIPGSSFHNGGRMKIGPDNKLYITTGDASDQRLAQQVESLAGKILRMNLDGSIPEDNPFENSYVYTLGHRNPQGIAWTEDGEMYASEHGSSAHDEINKIEAGSNYGWPVIKGDEEQEGMVTPIFHTGTDTWAPSGVAIEDNRLYIASLRGQALRAMDLNELEPMIITDEYGRIRDVTIENGDIYFINNNTDGRGSPATNDDRLFKVTNQ